MSACARPDLLPGIPLPVHALCRTLRGAGHEAYLVGGGLRDLLLGRGHATADWDVATSAHPQVVAPLFSHVIATGLQHGTVTVVEGGLAIEVTTYRTETSYRDGRRPEQVIFVRRLEDDLARRDFTINAMALDTESGALVDPFGGEADLGRGLIRAVGIARERFTEDGLRCLRAVRFAAVLRFDIEAQTLAAIPPTLGTFRRVAQERVLVELHKLLCGARPALGLEPMERSGLLAEILPELAAADGSLRALAVARVEAALPEFPLRFAALYADLGDAAASAALTRLRASSHTLRETLAFVDALARLREVEAQAAPLRRLVAVVTRERLARALALHDADLQARGASDETRSRAAAVRALAEEVSHSGAPLRMTELAVDGAEVAKLLGAPGPRVGQLLRLLLDEVLEEPSHNEPDWLRARAAQLGAQLDAEARR